MFRYIGFSSRLTHAQIDTLTRMLGRQGQQIIDPNIPLGAQSVNVYQQVEPNVVALGNLNFEVRHGGTDLGDTLYSIYLDPAGKELEPPLIQLPKDLLVTPAPPSRAMKEAQDAHEAGSFASIAFALDLLPASLLIVAAILLLKSKERGIQLHRIYVVLKLITSVLAGLATFLLLTGTLLGWAAPYLFIPPLLAFIYPIVLLCVLSRISMTPD